MPRVTRKYQVSIPKRIRERIGIKAGDEVGFEIRNHVAILKKKADKTVFDKYVGSARRTKRKDTDQIIEELRGEL